MPRCTDWEKEGGTFRRRTSEAQEGVDSGTNDRKINKTQRSAAAAIIICQSRSLDTHSFMCIIQEKLCTKAQGLKNSVVLSNIVSLPLRICAKLMRVPLFD